MKPRRLHVTLCLRGGELVSCRAVKAGRTSDGFTRYRAASPVDLRQVVAVMVDRLPNRSSLEFDVIGSPS